MRFHVSREGVRKSLVRIPQPGSGCVTLWSGGRVHFASWRLFMRRTMEHVFRVGGGLGPIMDGCVNERAPPK